ncbi:MAG TPA: UvrD-helicase domain-containing protein [Acidobacteriaceae bacterium]
MAEILPFAKPAEPVSERPSTIPDLAAREQALDTRASWIVEAPAGSGKTGLLMQRFLKLLADNATTLPEEVLAITFTRKATAELRTRVLEQLEAAHMGTPLRENASPFDLATRGFAEAVLERDALFGWGLLEHPGKLHIRTIDSLCGEIADTLPLLSGSGGGRSPVEEADPLYRLAARRTLMQLGGSDSALHHALHTVLLHRDGSLGDVESLLARMLQTREQWAELVPLDRESLDDEALETIVRPRLEASLEGIICAALTRSLNALSRPLLNELTLLAERLSIEPGYKGADSPIALCSNRHVPPEARADHLDHWTALIHLLLTGDGSWRKGFAVNHLGFKAPASDKQHLETLIATLAQNDDLRETLHSVRSLPSAHYPDDQWHVAKALFRLLLHALAELKVLFAERGECDFAELALAAREALQTESGAADLAASAGATLRHLLVDEMQDTSSAQYRLLELLTRSWDGGSQTLFLVGDPKQSIYLFRQARVERFLRTMETGRLGDVPLRALRLTANFRSQPALIEDFNHGFERIFPTPAQLRAAPDNGDVPFVAAHAVRTPAGSESTVWHTAVLDKPQPGQQPGSTRSPKQQQAQAEARTIRAVVEEWRSKPLPANRTEPWRIAVLARARRHLAPAVAEFQSTEGGREPIPFRAVKVESLGERQEVLDLLALTRALLHPADRAAWLAVLHAPWCGLGLADLIALTGEGAVMTTETARAATVTALVRDRSTLLSLEAQALLARAMPVLLAAQAASGREDLAVLVERTWLSLGGDAILRPEEVANARRYLTLLRDAQEPGSRMDLRVLHAQLSRLYAEAAALDDAVDLMTIHNAKGLEWDVVLVPSLERRGQATTPELLNWLELEDNSAETASVILAPIQRKGEQGTDLYKWIKTMIQAREKSERKRLLYVACTRARESLHLFAACERSSKGDVRPPFDTLLQSFWPVAQVHFAQHQAVPPSGLAGQFATALAHEDAASEAGALNELDNTAPEELSIVRDREPPLLHRLPLDYDPTQRYQEAEARRLPYPAATTLALEPAFQRPEGGFAVRAFGNVVHRYLQLLAERMDRGAAADALLDEMSTWRSRLTASFRGEGLPAATSTREAERALKLLTAALQDPFGRWILTPKPGAGSETALTLGGDDISTLRVDRTFLAGTAPQSSGNDTLWIVDFKTTEQGARNAGRFAEEERARYGPQLARYAKLLQAVAEEPKPIIFGLYYPAVPRLIHWQAE